VPDTQTFTAPELSDADTQASRGWSVVLYNDEIHEYLSVVFALQRAAGLSLEVAEAVTREAHVEGRSLVRSGLDQDEALVICAGLRRWTRIDGHTDGVACEAVRDDG